MRPPLAVSVTICLLSLAALAGTVPVQAAPDPDAPPTPAHQAVVLASSQYAMAAARAEADGLRAQPVPDDVVAQLALQMRIADAEFRYREAVRDEQAVVYAMATDPDVETRVMARLPAGGTAGLEATIGALRALWRAAGIDDFTQVRIRNNRDLKASAPLDALAGYYRSAGGRFGVDWTYLASINFIESDFGRVNGPSSAGALGPMQFMPATWAAYGGGGDVMNPQDAIPAAALYLNRMGAPGNMDRAIFRYNNDDDYVAAVEGFAGAIRSDPTWLSRLYYWSTFG